jgi:hypothetical protein
VVSEYIPGARETIPGKEESFPMGRENFPGLQENITGSFSAESRTINKQCGINVALQKSYFSTTRMLPEQA